eukprot:5284192-Pyramimonas_sp.AAC.1
MSSVPTCAPEALRFRLAQYIPQALLLHKGTKDMLQGLDSCRVINLTGTGHTVKYASFDGSLDFLSPRIGECTAWQWPAPQTRHNAKSALQTTTKLGTNSSTGCMLFVKIEVSRRHQFVQTWCPPESPQGQGGTIRYRWNGHYDPCLVMRSKTEPDHEHCQVLNDWRSKFWLRTGTSIAGSRCSRVSGVMYMKDPNSVDADGPLGAEREDHHTSAWRMILTHTKTTWAWPTHIYHHE